MNALGEGALEPAIKLLRQHIELTWKATPVENLRALLDQAARLAPEDDRVWLGRANLAIRTGAYDEAGRWLDACQRRRPDDVPVWRARLSWGIATNRIDVVQQADDAPASQRSRRRPSSIGSMPGSPPSGVMLKRNAESWNACSWRIRPI